MFAIGVSSLNADGLEPAPKRRPRTAAHFNEADVGRHKVLHIQLEAGEHGV